MTASGSWGLEKSGRVVGAALLALAPVAAVTPVTGTSIGLE